MDKNESEDESLPPVIVIQDNEELYSFGSFSYEDSPLDGFDARSGA